MRQTAFTLMEMLMTVTIVAILASVAIPTYTKTVRRAQGKAARDVLLSIFAGEQARQAATGNYVKASCADATAACYSEWQQLFMDIPNLNNPLVTYQVPTVDNTVTPPTFFAEAQINVGVLVSFMRINQFGTIWCPAASSGLVAEWFGGGTPDTGCMR